jgi:hypothetical protein
MDVDPDAAVIVEWVDSDGPKRVTFGPEIPWADRVFVLTTSNPDWGKIWLRNPRKAPLLWSSAHPADREAARVAIGQLVRPGHREAGYFAPGAADPPVEP